MKFFKLYILIFSFYSFNSTAATYTSVGCPGPVDWIGFNGTCPFFNGGTRLSSQPLAGDILTIPAGCTVTVKSSFTINNNIKINVFGQLKFTGNEHLDFDGCGSTVEVYPGGSIAGSSSSQQIKICGGNDWNGGSGTNYGPFTVTQNGNNLPIELLDFSGTCSARGVQLKWSTATELNNEYFTVEKSNNGSEWQFVVKVSGNGTTGSEHHYDFTDQTIKSDELIYYKLSQIDQDQTKTVFKAIDVVCGNDNHDKMVLISNPASTELNLLLTVKDISDNNTLRILNNFGEIVMESHLQLNRGFNSFTFPIDLNPGTYHILFASDKVILPGQKLLIVK